MGTKLPPPRAASVAANGAPQVLDTKPAPPPVLTRRGADMLVRVEQLLDDAGKAAGTTSSTIRSAGQPARRRAGSGDIAPPATSRAGAADELA